MAGDWIKLRTSLATDGRVRIVAKTLKKGNALGNATTNAYSVTVLGALVTLWSLADAQADEDGALVGYDFDDIDDLVGVPGFCNALPDDWISEEGGWIKLPNYQEHNGKNAKKRAQTAKRVANAKANAACNAEGNGEVTQQALPNALPREEKRRDKEKQAKENPPKRFKPPTVDEVRDYCRERGNNINPQGFVDHYAATNWHRGKTKISDWKACVRTWEKNARSSDKPDPSDNRPSLRML